MRVNVCSRASLRALAWVRVRAWACARARVCAIHIASPPRPVPPASSAGAALLATGPGVVAGGLATSFAFLACIAAPFPGFRDLGLTAGLGLLACMASSFLVLPALLLSYAGQTGVLLDNPGLTANPFFLLGPRWSIYPLVALATLATIIASQSLISGAFSLTAQAIRARLS